MANTNLNTTTVRFATGANNDQTFRVLNTSYFTPSAGLVLSGATYSATTTDYLTTINFGAFGVTAALTVATASPQIGDKLNVIAQGTATCSLVYDSNTFNVQTSNTATLSASKAYSASFVYNGYTWIGSGFSA